MSDSLNYLRAAAKAIGLDLPKEREEEIAETLAISLKQIEEIRPESNPMPAPTSFDPAWSPRK